MLKEKLEKINVVYILYIVIFILIVLCTVLFIQNNKMNRFIHYVYDMPSGRFQHRHFINEYNELAEIYQKKIFELERLQNEVARRIENYSYNNYDSYSNTGNNHRNNEYNHRTNNYNNQYNKRNEQRQNNIKRNNAINNNFGFETKTKTNRNGFIVEIEMPKLFTQDDVKIDLTGRDLSIKIEKQTDTKTNNGENYSYSSFFENFLVPETKATMKDVKIIFDIDDDDENELKVIVPIIK